MKNKIIKAVIYCVIFAAVCFGGYYGYKAYSASKATQAAPQYYTVTAEKMNLQVTVQGTGIAYAAVTKDVMPNNNGTLKDLSVKVGDNVTQGQKLFVSDSDELRKNEVSAENNLEKQKLTLALDQSAAKVDDKKVALDNLSISDAQTQLNNVYKQINNMAVTAPIGGVVASITYNNGDNIQANKSVLTIVDISSVKVKVSVDELNINKVKVGQNAIVKFDAIKDKSYEGTVDSISIVGTTANNVTTYGVVVAVKDPAGIRLGMNATVAIKVESKENTLVIPKEALIENDGGKFVMVIEKNSTNQDKAGDISLDQQGQNQSQSTKLKSSTRVQNALGKAKLVAIKTGLENDEYIEVVEGIIEGEKIIIELPDTTGTANDKTNQKKIKDLSGNSNTANKQSKTGNKK